MTQPQPLSAAVVLRGGKPMLLLNGRAALPFLYALTDCPGGRWTWEEFPQRHLRQFAAAGFRLFQVDLWLEQLFPEEDAFDLDLARQQIRGVLDARADAAVFIRLHVNSTHEWNRQHPEECVAYADTEPRPLIPWGLHRPLDDDEKNSLRHSLSSQAWRAWATERLQRFCQELAATPEGNAVVGIHPAGGMFGEWQQWGFIEHEPDCGPAMTAYFRRWLSEKYGSDAALQAAWGDSEVILSTATTPAMEERNRASDGIFRDPQRERKAIDYYQALQQSVAEAVLHFCRVIKESWPRPILAGAFYGYFKMLFGRQAIGGHLQMEGVLTSPHIDYLSGPDSYYSLCREIGGTGEARGLLGACSQHGKLWLAEMDQSTIHAGTYSIKIQETVEDDVGIIRRNLLQPFTRGHGLWFYDFGPRDSGGSWDDPMLMPEIERLHRALSRYYDRPLAREADVLVVYDTNCFYYLANRWTVDCVSQVAMDDLSVALYKAGVASDEALLFDLERIDWGRYRAVVFANTFLLTARGREYIRQAVARDGRHVVWNYLPGYTDGERLDLAYTCEVTGLTLALHVPAGPPVVTIAAPGLPAAEMSLSHAVPVPVVVDEGARSLGVLSGTTHVAFARKRGADHVAWFSSLPLNHVGVWRELLRQARAHIYVESGDPIYAGSGIVALHTLKGGPVRIRLRGGREIDLEMPRHSTAAFDGATGQPLWPIASNA